MSQLNDTQHIKRHTVIFLFVSTVVFFLQLPFLLKGEGYVVGTLTNDDTYYYLQTAWNMAHHGLCSFDGISTTNGVQILWFWILTSAAWFVPTKTILLATCMLLCLALNAISAGLIYLVFRSDKSDRLIPVFMVTLWCSVLVKGTYWLGLENSLHATIAWAIVLFIRKLLEQSPRRLILCSWILLGLLILNTYIRLDSAVVSAIIFCVGCVYLVRQGKGKSLPLMCIAGALSAAGLFGSYYLMGGTWIPVSGMVKQYWGHAAGHPSLPSMIVSSFPNLLPHSLSTSHFTWITLAFITFFFAIILAVQFKARTVGYLPLIAIILIAANLCYLSVYYFGNISYDLYYRWYKSWQHIMWLLIIGEVLTFFVRYGMYPRAKAIRTVCVGVVLTIFALLTIRQGYQKYNYPYQDYTWHQRYLAAKWINHNMPLSIVIGSWNAGQVGYFSERATVNLDGLINGRKYYEDVVKGEMPLSQYLNEQGITHLFEYPSGALASDIDLCSLPVEKEFSRVEFGKQGESMFLWKWLRNDYLVNDDPYAY